MSQLNPFGLLIVIASLLVPVFFLPAIAQKHDVLALFSQYFGMTALIAMAWGQLIATRISGIEAVFGGLDRGYILHKWLGILAIVAILLHDTIDADMRGLGVDTLLTDIAETFGEVSLYGLLILVVITIATFIPYHLWRWTHKFMGLFFLLSALHYLFILKPFQNVDPLGLYISFFCGVGVLSFLYRLAPNAFRPSKPYQLKKKQQDSGALCLEFDAIKSPVKHRAGQFAFLQFPENVSKEPHPFTISSAPNLEGSLRFTIAPLGDFTSGDLLRLKEGDDIKIEGPFGRFFPKKAGNQIWIAGGIGITPFAAWVEMLQKEKTTSKITLYYCVKKSDSAVHLKELREAARGLSAFKLVVVESYKGKRLSAEMIAEDHGAELQNFYVYFCGPALMRKSLIENLARYGVSARRFHYEEFEIRSGIGLKKLAQFALNRLLPPRS